jgi:integrase
MNLNMLLESFLQSRVLRPKSIHNYRAVCRQFVTFLGADYSLQTLTIDELTQFRDYILGRASPTTFNNYRRHLSAIFSHAVDIRELSENPWRRVRAAPVLKVKPKTVNTEDLLRAVDLFSKRAEKNWGEAGKKWGEFWTTLIRTLYFTGMRRRQIVELQWSDVDFDENVLTLRAGSSKTRREWIIPLPIQIRGELLALRQSVEVHLGHAPAPHRKVFDPYPFAPRTRLKMGNPLTEDRLSLFFRRLSEKAGVRMSSHRIRHTTATTLVNKGKDLKAAQIILGHTDVKTTLGYVHPNMDDLRKASDSLQWRLPDQPNS